MGIVQAMSRAPTATGPAWRVAAHVARRRAGASASFVVHDAGLPDAYVVLQLERLRRLRERGAISADELEALTARLVGR
jgi:hypothetical protein